MQRTTIVKSVENVSFLVRNFNIYANAVADTSIKPETGTNLYLYRLEISTKGNESRFLAF